MYCIRNRFAMLYARLIAGSLACLLVCVRTHVYEWQAHETADCHHRHLFQCTNKHSFTHLHIASCSYTLTQLNTVEQQVVTIYILFYMYVNRIWRFYTAIHICMVYAVSEAACCTHSTIDLIAFFSFSSSFIHVRFLTESDVLMKIPTTTTKKRMQQLNQ